MRKSSRQLRQDLQDKLDQAGEFYVTRMPATLGNHSGVVAVPDTQNMVYARVDSGQVVKVFNSVAPNIYNWKVFIGQDKSQPGVLKVLEVRWIYNLAQTVAYVLFHHKQHEYPNPDTVWILRDQFMPLLVLPAGGFTAILYGDYIYDPAFMDYPIRVTNVDDIDMTPYLPPAGARYVLLQISPAGDVDYVVGDIVDSRDVLHFTPLPKPTESYFPVVAFELFEGQTELRRDSTERTIIDLRMFTSASSPTTGTQIDSATEVTSIDATDYVGLWDSVLEQLEKISWPNLLATAKSYFDTLYAAIAHTHSYAAEAFKTISISGQSDVVADTGTDTLTLVAGNGVTITTDAPNDKITFTNTREIVMESGVTHPPVPIENSDGTDWVYSS